MSKAKRKRAAKRLGMSGGSSGFMAAGGIFQVDGQNRQNFIKDMISVGVYTHPIWEWTMDVTTERLDQWVASFNVMKANGVDVEAVVDHRMDAEAVRGYVTDMFREDDTLFGVHEMRGDDAIELAKTVKNVSVLVDREFVDGAGNAYGEAITHSAIVQQPIVPGQSEFEPIAASRSVTKKVRQSVPIFVLQAAKKSNANQETDEMDMKELAKILGAGDELTEDNALSRIKERIEAGAADKESLSAQISTLTGEIEALKAKLDDPKASIKVDEDALDMLVEGAEAKIDTLIAAGKLTPAAAKQAKELLIGAPGKRNTYMLSRRISGTAEAVIKSVLAILETNDTVALGEQTTSQALALSRTTPGGDEKKPDADYMKARAQRVMQERGIKTA